MQRLFFTLMMFGVLTGCDLSVMNSPYGEVEADKAVLYTSFALRPKHLDPARSYSANEAIITVQTYEPPYQYHYLKRPYELQPLTAAGEPVISYYDAGGKLIREVDYNQPDQVALTRYLITIQPDILYQPHPAFVQDQQGNYVYHTLVDADLRGIQSPMDFQQLDTRTLTAEDYVYQIKRLAHPEVSAPILGLMKEHIVGLDDFATSLSAIRQTGQVIDLRQHEIAGVTALNAHQYEILINGLYPQMRYWLAMPFFAPIPWEAERFYAQPALIAKNISLDWYPVGTGPFMMVLNDPNRQMVLAKNPHFRGEAYPEEGNAEDIAQGLLNDAGKMMPFLDKIVFSLEKESTAYWGKFLQGYYDVSGVTSDGFDQAVSISSSGEFGLSEAMKAKGISLETAVRNSTFYIGFNMRDPVVGGDSERARKLRNAIAIAIDQEEFISIFANGQGVPAQSPIPPGIFGFVEGEAGIDPYVYRWEKGEAVKRKINEAKVLLSEAGYPQGRDADTGEPLILHFDVAASAPDQRAQLEWMRQQLRKIDIQLVVRNTDYNRFQEKMRLGTAQIFRWGWNADYPDPENFLFLLYGPNAKAINDGVNAANYQNDKYDSLFEKMRGMPDGEERQTIINQMLAIARHDVPWVWGYHPQAFNLFHAWNKNVKSLQIGGNHFKYRRIDTEARKQLQSEWNRPILWPMGLLLITMLILIFPAMIVYYRKRYQV